MNSLLGGNALLALAAAMLWGGGDFTGGMGVKRAGGSLGAGLRIVLLSHATSFIVLVAVAHLRGDAAPHGALLGWGIAAGVAGGLSLTAAGTYPDRVVAAGSFHGGRLATDAPDSPHLLAPKMRGEIYVGVAGDAPYLSPGETERIDMALRDGGTNYTVEVYPGAQHGFAVPDVPAYDRDASERHWEKLLDLFKRNLPGG